LIGLFIIRSFDIQNKIIFIAILLTASVIPDIDSHKSKIGKKIKPVSFLINFFLGHRGIFHSVFLPLLISLLILLINYELTIAFFIGYLSHLVLDSLTPGGIMLFYPFSKKRLKGFIRTGSLVENILFILLLILCFYIVI
jgi:inner membrane protein